MSRDSIGDFLTVIRNGIMRAKPWVEVPYSKLKHEIAKILEQEGFIKAIALVDESAKPKLKVFLKYVDGESAIHELKRESTPGRRVYTHYSEIRPVIGGLGVSIMTTNRGVMSNKKAKELHLGGELICTVW